MKKHTFVLGLGSNLGAPLSNLCAAVDLLRTVKGLEVQAESSIYRSKAIGPPQADYLNAAVRVCWSRDPAALLKESQRIESLLGRRRVVAWGARTIDIDILCWDGEAIDDHDLKIPHPHLLERPFALVPAAEVWEELPVRPRDPVRLQAVHTFDDIVVAGTESIDVRAPTVLDAAAAAARWRLLGGSKDTGNLEAWVEPIDASEPIRDCLDAVERLSAMGVWAVTACITEEAEQLMLRVVGGRHREVSGRTRVRNRVALEDTKGGVRLRVSVPEPAI